MDLLKGIRVLDLTRLHPGPYCTMLLADMGADVIKIEEPGRGDYSRWTPPLIKEIGAGFITLNRNKRSICLNLKNEKGRTALLKMVEQADVFIEGFRPGVMERLGLDYENLSKINPRLIYCSLTGYGQDGPYKKLVGHDLNYLALGGIVGLSTEASGSSPALPTINIADLGGGALMAGMGILAALAKRNLNNEGNYIDISMLDGVVSLLTFNGADFLSTGKQPSADEHMNWGGCPGYDIYATKDGRYISVGALEKVFWENFCSALGHPELIEKQWVKGSELKRVREIIASTFKTKTREEWLSIFQDLDVCVSPVNNLEEVMNDPQVRHRNMIVEVDQPQAGPVQIIGNPIKIPTAGTTEYHPAPGLGEHTRELLLEVGYTDEEIEDLISSGAAAYSSNNITSNA